MDTRGGSIPLLPTRGRCSLDIARDEGSVCLLADKHCGADELSQSTIDTYIGLDEGYSSSLNGWVTVECCLVTIMAIWCSGSAHLSVEQKVRDHHPLSPL